MKAGFRSIVRGVMSLLASATANAILLFHGGAADGSSGRRIPDFNLFASAADFTTSAPCQVTDAEF
jgi:hypothetical protein